MLIAVVCCLCGVDGWCCLLWFGAYCYYALLVGLVVGCVVSLLVGVCCCVVDGYLSFVALVGLCAHWC